MATAILRCKNHPTYRWSKNKHGPGYGGHGVLLFTGEEGGLPASPFNTTEAQLAQAPPEYQTHFRERYTPECDCPLDDLEIIRVVE